jgi:hypothetical protein
MPLNKAWIQVSLKVTGHFEDSTDPLGGVSGDFDGMGLSLGVLQWNIGMGSLQPLVKGIGRAAVVDTMPVFGGELWTACTSNISQGLAIVRSWQTGQRLRPAVKAELKTFAHSEAFVSQQIAAAQRVAEQAWLTASTWNTEVGQDEPSLQEFCWFFDLMTQNGGLKGISPTAVKEFIAVAGLSRADDLVCDWLEGRTEADRGFKDALKNAQLWRDTVPDANLLLFVASYLRSQKANLPWRTDTLNRKGTIALGTGWVHGEQHELKAVFDAAL